MPFCNAPVRSNDLAKLYFFHGMNSKIPWVVTQIDWNISRVSSELFIISYILIAITKMKEQAI